MTVRKGTCMHICRNRYLIIVSILGLCCIISRARESQRQRCTEEGMPLFVNYALFLFKTPLTPPPFLDIFMTYWEALCTTLRLDRIRHRSEETVKYTRIFGKLPRGAGRPFSIQKIILQILHLYMTRCQI